MPTLNLEPVIKLLEQGWTKGAFHNDLDGQDKYCLLGAAGYAWHDLASWFLNCGTVEELRFLGRLADYLDVDFVPTELELEALIWDGDAFPLTVLSYWNDHVAKSVDEVIAALREFMEKEREAVWRRVCCHSPDLG